MCPLYSREDWTLFRSVQTLCQKSGVPPEWLQRLVLKELADNALDHAGNCAVGYLDDESEFFVEDGGDGIEPKLVPELFSINRPLTSSKLERLPTRGALGNGLRVVTGAVLATEGSLRVFTRGQCLDIRPQDTGESIVESTTYGHRVGTRIEVVFGSTMPYDDDPLEWAELAIKMTGNAPIYKGKTSAFWEDGDSFFERCQAAGNATVRDLVQNMDGCSGHKAMEIAAEFSRRPASSLSRKEASQILTIARKRSAVVQSSRLRLAKSCGVTFDGASFASEKGLFVSKSSRPPHAINIPFTVEAWVGPSQSDGDDVRICVNRTPVAADVSVSRDEDKTNVVVWGCELGYTVKVGRKPVDIVLNVQTPYIPIMSDGKAPNLGYFVHAIRKSIEKAARSNQRKHRTLRRDQPTQKQVILENLDAAARKASGRRKSRYSQRRLFYAVRPYLLKAFDGAEPHFETFKAVITEHEDHLGHDLPGIYRDSRGTLYHPHTGETYSLGTLMVESYRRPLWTFSKILYVEKEGVFPTLIDAKWPERHDCALLTSKGFATRAARDLIDMLGESGQQLTFFCAHDADASGTTIYEKVQQATKARPARRVPVVNLGLEPWEALVMDLQIETFTRDSDRRLPVAQYVMEREERDWAEWLQSHRVELDAMSTDEFIAWLDSKIAPYETGKLVPPNEVLTDTLNERVRQHLRKSIVEQILRAARIDEQVAAAFASLNGDMHESKRRLVAHVRRELEDCPERWWRDPVEELATQIVKGVK